MFLSICVLSVSLYLCNIYNFLFCFAFFLVFFISMLFTVSISLVMQHCRVVWRISVCAHVFIGSMDGSVCMWIGLTFIKQKSKNNVFCFFLVFLIIDLINHNEYNTYDINVRISENYASNSHFFSLLFINITSFD